MSARIQTGIDVGGTFTDLASWDGDRLITAKVATPPTDQSEGVVSALGTAGSRPTGLLHGTTVATNALLERSGARTALVTDAGFEDLIEIGRQDRPSLYDVARVRTTPLVPAGLRFGVPGRDTFGEGGSTVDLALDELVRDLADSDPEAVAISCLYSFLEPSRESRLAEAIRSALPEAAVSASWEVAPEFREFERTSTTLINAYLVPLVGRYLTRLARVGAESGVVGSPAVMRSSGGLMALEDAARLPAAIVLSGPAGGVVAASAYGTALGHRSLISFDMGGTSTDVCRITDGRPEVRFERPIDGLPNRMPSVAIHTVGAGGGSIGWVDAGGALRVGPRSAGAVPGPAAYGLGGTAATVTDADLIVGRLGVGGALALDSGLARQALSGLAEELDIDLLSSALGMIEVVEAHMERAVRVVSVEQGSDPREAMLVAFGGAGAMHATALARRLGMRGVLIPPHAGVFSALGLLLAPPRTDVVRGALVAGAERLEPAVDEALGEARNALRAAGSDPEEIDATLDVRYRGQSHETTVAYEPGSGWPALEAAFHEAHRIRNGFARIGDPIEVVAVRAAAVGRPALSIDDLAFRGPLGSPERGEREVMGPAGSAQASVWWRPALEPGSEIVGPAIIEEPEATTFLASGERAVVDHLGAMEVAW